MTGPVDRDKLLVVERVFSNRIDGLLADTEYIPSWARSTELRLSLSVGIEADECRFDVAWWRTHGYKYHYSEPDGLQYRYGWEERPGLPDKHFHPPGALDTHEPSLIQHEEPELVTHAVISDWIHAANHDDPSLLHTKNDLP